MTNFVVFMCWLFGASIFYFEAPECPKDWLAPRVASAAMWPLFATVHVVRSTMGTLGQPIVTCSEITGQLGVRGSK